MSRYLVEREFPEGFTLPVAGCQNASMDIQPSQPDRCKLRMSAAQRGPA